MKRRAWTDWEDRKLIENYRAGGLQQAVAYFGSKQRNARTRSSVQRRVGILDLDQRSLPAVINSNQHLEVVGAGEVVAELGITHEAARIRCSQHPQAFKRGKFWMIPRSVLDQWKAERNRGRPPGWLTSAEAARELGISNTQWFRERYGPHLTTRTGIITRSGVAPRPYEADFYDPQEIRQLRQERAA